MELLDIFYLWSVPYIIVEGSLLNLYRWPIVIVDLLIDNLSPGVAAVGLVAVCEEVGGLVLTYTLQPGHLTHCHPV